MQRISNDLYYTCSLIEYIGRKTKNQRADIVNQLGNKLIQHVFKFADVFHCEPIEAVADRFIEEAKIEMGTFDNVADCKYSVPSYWDIGAVYQRLIEGINKGDYVETLIEVYNSWLSLYINNYNIAVYYMTPDYLRVSYEEGQLLD